jgi:hypothetical protein
VLEQPLRKGHVVGVAECPIECRESERRAGFERIAVIHIDTVCHQQRSDLQHVRL